MEETIKKIKQAEKLIRDIAYDLVGFDNDLVEFIMEEISKRMFEVEVKLTHLK